MKRATNKALLFIVISTLFHISLLSHIQQITDAGVVENILHFSLIIGMIQNKVFKCYIYCIIIFIQFPA